MELKHIKLKEAEAEKALLIVPYGIETFLICMFRLYLLLF